MEEIYRSLNPLNQVYVFNSSNEKYVSLWGHRICLNPLNQVYVFNIFLMGAAYGKKKIFVLIP